MTGAAGFIGTHLTDELMKNGHQVKFIDVRYGSPGHDLRDPETITEFLAHKPDAVVHLAAKVGRLFGEDNPLETVTDNAGMTALVAKACGEAEVRLVYASTSEVYGDRRHTTCYESDTLTTLPHNIYGLSKRHGEDICRLYAPKGLTIWRISMPFGPGLPAGRGRAAIINMLYQALYRMPIVVHRGSERSWCWVGDTVRAMRYTIEDSYAAVYNIGRDDNPTTMLNVAKIACDLTGAPYSLIEEVDPPERQTVVKRLGTDKIRSLGWKPEVSLEEGMKRTLEWVKSLPAPLETVA